MSAQANNLAQVDVLAVLDRLIGNARTMAGLSGDPRMRDNLREGEQARRAVAELVAADREYDAAETAWRDAQVNATGDESPGAWRNEAQKQWQRLGAAARRRAAALRPFNGSDKA